MTVPLIFVQQEKRNTYAKIMIVCQSRRPLQPLVMKELSSAAYHSTSKLRLGIPLAPYLLEHLTGRQGGPPRHLHYEQDEWFYAVQGSFLLEIGDECFGLSPGDSILAPRKVPHARAFKGEGQGRLLIAFQPAGLMESFFEKLSEFRGIPVMEELKGLFATYGMELVGPPLLSTNQ